jgi:hypothetical protein
MISPSWLLAASATPACAAVISRVQPLPRGGMYQPAKDVHGRAILGPPGLRILLPCLL